MMFLLYAQKKYSPCKIGVPFRSLDPLFEVGRLFHMRPAEADVSIFIQNGRIVDVWFHIRLKYNVSSLLSVQLYSAASQRCLLCFISVSTSFMSLRSHLFLFLTCLFLLYVSSVSPLSGSRG